jgi:hypothetical protein
MGSKRVAGRMKRYSGAVFEPQQKFPGLLEHFAIGMHQRRHCEEPRRGDEAIQKLAQAALDCFASLAMTIQNRPEML